MERETRVTVRPAIVAVLEEGDTSWGAYAPAVPGVIGLGETAEEAQRSLEDGLMYHFEENLRQEEERAAQAAEKAKAS